MRIGPYNVAQVLGRGAMGEVRRAVHVPTGASVALKLVLGDHDPRFVAALAREVRAMASLHHGGVLAVLDQGTVAADDVVETVLVGTPYVVTELADGDLLSLRPVGRARCGTRSARSSERSLTPTRAAWCIAISSPRTC